MKKIVLCILAVIFAICLFSCQNDNGGGFEKGEPEEHFSVVINTNIPKSCILEGNVSQTVSASHKFEPVKIIPEMGYEYLYYEVNGTKFEENTIELSNINEDTVVTVYADYATYELPIINITADGEINSKTEYVDMTFSLTNCEGELENITGGIRLRGNSTRKLPKKPYRIKFDSKQSLFGLDKAKSWVLLAEYMDPSALHNHTAMTLGNESDGLRFTTTANKVNVYLNGEFMGLYTLCEQVQENEGRIDIEKDITEDMTDLFDFNFFMCMDKSVTEDTDSILGETYFYLEEYDRYFELKYPEKGDFCSDEQFQKFFNDLIEYTRETLEIMETGSEAEINDRINTKSLVDYLIIDNIMIEHDHAYKSFNMFYTTTSENPEENGKLNFGPIWDYDWSLNTNWTGAPNEDYEIKATQIRYTNIYYKAMQRFDSYQELIKERYNGIFEKALGNYIDGIDGLAESMKTSIALNEEKWYGDYGKDISNLNIKFLKDFLIARKAYLDGQWK